MKRIAYEEFIGRRFGALVIGDTWRDAHGVRWYTCTCDCSKLHSVRYSGLTQGQVKSCGCQRYEGRSTNYHIGERFGMLTIKAPAEKPARARDCGRQSIRWVEVDCDCGTRGHIARLGNVTQGRSKSCGCLIRLARQMSHRRTHGMSQTDIYRFWAGLRSKDLLDERWSKFANFYADMGVRPAKHSLPRLNMSKPYSVENCPEGWVPRRIAARSGKRARPVTVRGETRTRAEWADLAGVSRQCFQQWLDDTPSRKLGLPARKRSEDDIYNFVHASRFDAAGERTSVRVESQVRTEATGGRKRGPKPKVYAYTAPPRLPPQE